MRAKESLAYTSFIGGLIGFFILHPLVMLIGHLMSEHHASHEYAFSQIILAEALKSISPEMLPWSFAFTVTGLFAGFLYGKNRHIKKILEHFSYFDYLTGIPNRRHFNESIELEWRNGARLAKPVSLIMCDIDFFKSYNDEYGHQKGDRCLQAIAKSIRDLLGRPRDIVARFGGEEFAILLPETDERGANLLAESICNAVRSLGILHQKSSISDFVTISLGVATLIPTEEVSANILITVADQALYLAKLKGRDRIENSG